jgi:phosphatidylethanolamine/phosphatidyl-N-methylethanolamine N-methyltransferase
MLDNAAVVATYARWAPIYDYVFGAITRSAVRSAVGVINRMPPSRVLEVGVGTGTSLPFYNSLHRVVGIDLSPDMLRLAAKRVTRGGLRQVEALAQMDANNLAFRNASFDAAVAMFVMSVVPDPERVLAEMVRVVTPRGRIVTVNHFSVDTGPRGVIERWLSRFAGQLGWHADFRIERVLAHPDLKLIQRKPMIPRIYTLLVFERI